MPFEEPPVVQQPFSNSPEASDETVWRGRALEAESKIADLEASLVQLKAELASARQTLQTFQRRREIEQQIIDSKASDVETAMLLVEQTLAKKADLDVAGAVAEIRTRKPHLFESSFPKATGFMAASGSAPTISPAEAALRDAHGRKGERKSLLKYLRLKRTTT